MVNRGALERWLVRNRRDTLIILDAVAWALSITAFTLLRYLDVPGGVPWARMATGIAIAIGVQMVMGTLFWLYDGRYRVGSRDEAVAVGTAFVATMVILQFASLRARWWRPPARVSIPIAGGAGRLGGGDRCTPCVALAP